MIVTEASKLRYEGTTVMTFRNLFVWIFPALLSANSFAQIRSGLVITESKKFKPNEFLATSKGVDSPAIRIKGNNITIDFGGATLRGTKTSAESDQRAGLGIQVTGKNITIKNLNIHGYKVGIFASDCNKLTLQNVDASYNWKQHLKSDLEKENLDDWMSYHQNEKDEWLRSGAAIYIKNGTNFEVRDCKAVGGQCGLMLMRATKGKIWNNNFSFLSGVGLGMYRSSDNLIMYNKLDWCVRGYSHGVYNRGQDSTGILIYEQSNNNLFAYNSVTHGGDGFFLWAGQTTMDTGKGGCNDNLVYGNDFSHSPANAIETTFSRNKFVNNLLADSWHGVWGGYSFDSLFQGNILSDNLEGIAIEHGQNNSIYDNAFYRNGLDINLWMNDSQDPSWGYPKGHDTVSHDYQIIQNSFWNSKEVFNIRKTKAVKIDQSAFSAVAKLFHDDTQKDAVEWGSNIDVPAQEKLLWNAFASSGKFSAPKPLAGAKYPFLSKAFDAQNLQAGGVRRGRKYILVDEWGPFDFQAPRVWPKVVDGKIPPTRAGEIPMQIVGPAGNWKLISASKGVNVHPKSGKVGDVIVVEQTAESHNRVDLEFEYTGGSVTDYKGNKTAAGKPYIFGYHTYKLAINWDINWYNWDAKTEDPRMQDEAFHKLLAGTAASSLKTNDLNFAWGGSPANGVGSDHFATTANGTFDIESGNYNLEVTADDGVRVWLDDKLLIDEWHYSAPTTYTKPVKLTTGKHKLRVEHFEIDGYSTLVVKLKT